MDVNENITLAEATTEQIITELFSRETFIGIIVYSNNPHKFDDQYHPDIEFRASTDVKGANKLLEIGKILIQNDPENEEPE